MKILHHEEPKREYNLGDFLSPDHFHKTSSIGTDSCQLGLYHNHAV